MKNDERLRQKALTGIVKSGSVLRIDVARYENELKNLKPASKTVAAPATKTSEKKIQPKVWLETNPLSRFDSCS